MGELMGFIAAAVIVEGILSYAKEIVENKKIHWEIIGAILIGCLVSFNLNLDFFKMLGLKETYGIIGVILTGVLISRGSNYVFELYDRLTKWKSEDKAK
jgi:hypothetical protein